MRFRSRPSEVEAVQWKGGNWTEVMEFLAGSEEACGRPVHRWSDVGNLFNHRLQLLAGVDGAQGWVEVPRGHWVVRSPGDHRDYWPVEPAYFEGKYELADG